jgi:hypothetical protein
VAVRRAGILALLVAVGCGAAPRAPFAPCPIGERQCRIDTLLALEGERGQLWDPWTQPPFVRVISLPELEQRLNLLARLNPPPVGSDSFSDSLRQLGLLAPDLGIAEADRRWDTEQPTAYYWSHDKEVTIIDRGQPLDDIWAVATLAHEYTHAAQDREFGLVLEVQVATTDHEMVLQSLVEGEAGLYGFLAHLRMQGTDPVTYDSDGYYRRWLNDVRADTASVASPHTHVRRALPYPVGGLLMARAWARGRSAAATELLLHPPRSFAAIMRSIADRPEPGPPRPFCQRRAIPADQFQALASDRLGAGLLYAYLVRAFGGEPEAWEAALTWSGDQLWSLRDVKLGHAVTFWNVHVPGFRDTQLGAVIAAGSGPPRLVGDDLLFWTGLDEAAVPVLHQATSCGN